MIPEKRKLNDETIKLKNRLEEAFAKERLDYDIIHPSYNSIRTRNDDEIIFTTCYVEKMEPYGIHIDNRRETDKWVIDVVIMKPENTAKIISILEKSGLKPEKYGKKCHGEFAGHWKLYELEKDTDFKCIEKINIDLLKLFQCTRGRPLNV